MNLGGTRKYHPTEDEGPLWVNYCHRIMLMRWSSCHLEWRFLSSFTCPLLLLIFIHISLSNVICLHNPLLQQKEPSRFQIPCLSTHQCLRPHTVPSVLPSLSFPYWEGWSSATPSPLSWEKLIFSHLLKTIAHAASPASPDSSSFQFA